MIINFAPAATANFQFDVTLDGNSYSVITRWNFYAQRYYFFLYDNASNLIVTKPLIGSPPNYAINLLFGYFKSTMVFYEAAQQFVITP